MPDALRHPLRQIFLPGALLLLCGMAFAQSSAEPTRSALPSKLMYESPLRAYKAYADQSVESWREANDRVGRIGGWRAYAREIQTGVPAQDLPAPAKAPADAPKAPVPAADPHAGHHGGKQ